MSAWQRRERAAAAALGSRRVVRHRGESRPDVEPVALPSGEVLQPEVKHRKRLPRLLSAALAQALRYEPGATPVAVVSEHRGAALAVLRLADFTRLVGVTLELPKPRRKRAPKRRKPWSQLSLISPDGATVHVVDVAPGGAEESPA